MNRIDEINMRILSEIPPSEWVEINKFSTIKVGVTTFNLMRTSCNIKRSLCVRFDTLDLGLLIPCFTVSEKMTLKELRKRWVNKPIYALYQGDKPVRIKIIYIEPSFRGSKLIKDFMESRFTGLRIKISI